MLQNALYDFVGPVLARRETLARRRSPHPPTISVVRPPNHAPEKVTSRPPEPVRPDPAVRSATSLLAVKARRRRFRLVPPTNRQGSASDL